MNTEKPFLKEVAHGVEAIKTSREEPLAQESAPRQKMDFIRSLVLDMPVQTYKEIPLGDNMNIEKMIETRLEAEVKKMEQPQDKVDTVTVDIPLLLRLLEYAKEDAKTDMDLHDVTEKLILLSKEHNVLSMDQYSNIVQKNSEVEPNSAYDQQNESVTSLQRLAGIK